jgi:hypothetical protein
VAGRGASAEKDAHADHDEVVTADVDAGALRPAG